MDELKEALNELGRELSIHTHYIKGTSTPISIQWSGPVLTKTQAAAILAHIAAQDESIRVLKRNWKSATEELRVYLDQVGKQKDHIAALEAALAKAHDTIEEKAMEDDLEDWPNWPEASTKQ